jgi:hypothetical protein
VPVDRVHRAPVPRRFDGAQEFLRAKRQVKRVIWFVRFPRDVFKVLRQQTRNGQAVFNVSTRNG